MEIKLNMDNLTEQERDALMGLVEKANKPVQKVWKPEKREEYWSHNSCGEIMPDSFDGNSVDSGRYAVGNCFRTRGEALFAVEKLKVIAELKRFAEEHNEGKIDWADITYKFCIVYSCTFDTFEIMNTQTVKNSVIYFSSYQIAQQAIATIGEERIKKYYLEVE